MALYPSKKLGGGNSSLLGTVSQSITSASGWVLTTSPINVNPSNYKKLVIFITIDNVIIDTITLETSAFMKLCEISGLLPSSGEKIMETGYKTNEQGGYSYEAGLYYNSQGNFTKIMIVAKTSSSSSKNFVARLYGIN